MHRQSISRRDALGWGPPSLFVLAAMLLALTACGPETLVVGLEPTPTPTPLPTPVVQSYINDAYGFAFRYPETWTLEAEPQLVTLTQGSLTLSIAHGWASKPGFRPMGGAAGMPAGDLIYAGKIFFLGQTIPTRVLEYQRKDKMVLYGETGLVEVGDLAFSIWLEDVGGTAYAELDIPKDRQAEAKEILASFERIAATGRPPVSTPTPAPDANLDPAPTSEQDLMIYTNDDYQLAFLYPRSWELDQIPAGQEVPGGRSATAVHLTKGPLRLAIQLKRPEEATVLGASGRPAGEIEEAGTVTVLGREIPMQALMHDGKVKSIFLGDQVDDLELYVQLDGGVGAGTAYEAVDIPAEDQATMEAILNSLHRTGELKSFGPETLTYENASYGFSFQYPASWTLQEAAGEAVEEGVKLADAVIVKQGRFAIVIQYQLASDPAQIAWGGSFVPGGLGTAEATWGERLTLLGEETHKRVWTDDAGVKAIAVSTSGKDADLVLSITLGDSSVRIIQDPQAETIPEPAIAALDQILASLTVNP